MKRFFLVTCILLSQVACGTDDSASKMASGPVVIDAKFNDIYSDFETDTGISPWGVSIGFGTVYGETYANCYHSEMNNTWKITVSPTVWVMYDVAFQQALVYHELGHCLKNLPDSNDNGLMNAKNLFSIAKDWANKISYLSVFY